MSRRTPWRRAGQQPPPARPEPPTPDEPQIIGVPASQVIADPRRMRELMALLAAYLDDVMRQGVEGRAQMERVTDVRQVIRALRDAYSRGDVYVRKLNVMPAGLRTEVIDDGVHIDWWTDSDGVERVAGVEVLEARSVKVDGREVR